MNDLLLHNMLIIDVDVIITAAAIVIVILFFGQCTAIAANYRI